MRAGVLRLAMAHPGDVSALERLIAEGAVRAADIVAVIGKTEGNGGVNDFTRGYFTPEADGAAGRALGEPAEAWSRASPASCPAAPRAC